jgi:hypothetical protein
MCVPGGDGHGICYREVRGIEALAFWQSKSLVNSSRILAGNQLLEWCTIESTLEFSGVIRAQSTVNRLVDETFTR